MPQGPGENGRGARKARPDASSDGAALMLARAIGPAVRALDALLVRAYGLQSLSGRGRGCGDEGLRVRLRRAPRAIRLSSGELPAGTLVMELHLCNDRAPEATTRTGAATWATRLLVRYRRSCRAIAARLVQEPRLAKVGAVGGVTAIFGGADGHGGAGRLPAHLGFEVLEHPGHGHLADALQRLYAWSLLAAYAPGSLQGRRLDQLGFVEVWMDRDAFLKRFGPRP